jgi:NAD(P)H-dependent FMN reductase
MPSLIWVRDLDLPMYTPERAVPAAPREPGDTGHGSDALIWSTPTYHGSVSGSSNNALDWLFGAEVVRAARPLQAHGTCGYADAAQFGPAVGD